MKQQSKSFSFNLYSFLCFLRLYIKQKERKEKILIENSILLRRYICSTNRCTKPEELLQLYLQQSERYLQLTDHTSTKKNSCKHRIY